MSAAAEGIACVVHFADGTTVRGEVLGGTLRVNPNDAQRFIASRLDAPTFAPMCVNVLILGAARPRPYFVDSVEPMEAPAERATVRLVAAAPLTRASLPATRAR